MGRAEDALAASSRSLVQHGALVAASWDSDDAGPPPPPPPRDRPHQPSADDDSALDSVVSDLDDLDARLARLRGRRAAATAPPPPVVETARPPQPPSSNPVPKIERTNRDVLDFLETSSGPSRTPKQQPAPSPARRVVNTDKILGDAPARRRRKPMAVGSAPPSTAPVPAPSSRSVDRDRRQRIAKLRRDRAELSPAGFPATLRG